MSEVEKTGAISLSTAQNNLSSTVLPVPGGSLDFDENVRKGLFSTVGTTSYLSREDFGPLSMTSTGVKGGTVFTIALEPASSSDPVVKSLAQSFIYFNIASVVLVFKCIAPWSTASGSMQIGYNPDPENPLSVTAATAIKQLMRLMQSKQLSSKGEVVTHSLVSETEASQVFKGKRYCKKATVSVPRTESFGYMQGIVRGVPDLGDGTTWTATLCINWQFHMATYNATAALFQEAVSLSQPTLTVDAAHNSSCDIFIIATFPSTGKKMAGTFQPYFISDNYITLSENQDGNVVNEVYFYTNNSALAFDDGEKLDIYLITQYSSKASGINDPETCEFTSTLDLLEGALLYEDESVGFRMPIHNAKHIQSKKSIVSYINSLTMLEPSSVRRRYKRIFS